MDVHPSKYGTQHKFWYVLIPIWNSAAPIQLYQDLQQPPNKIAPIWKGQVTLEWQEKSDTWNKSY